MAEATSGFNHLRKKGINLVSGLIIPGQSPGVNSRSTIVFRDALPHIEVDQMIAHLEALHSGTAGTGESICFAWAAAQQPWTHVWPDWETIVDELVRPSEHKFWQNFLRNGSHSWNMYTGVSAYKTAEAWNWRKQKNVTTIPGVWADFDVKPDLEGHFHSPEELEVYLAKLPPMTVRVASGSGGVHGYWLFDKRMLNGQRVTDLLEGWHEYLQTVAGDKQVDNVQEVARVMRIAGTVRWAKANDHESIADARWRQVELQHVATERYNAEDFEAFTRSYLEIKRERERVSRETWTRTRENAIASLEHRGLKAATRAMLEMKFDEMQDWEVLLTRAGWTLNSDKRGHGGSSACRYWTRPGKDPKDGGSASTDFQGSNIITFFSADVPQLTELVVPGLTGGNNKGASTKYRFALIALYGGDEGRLIRDIVDGKGRLA